MMGRCTQRAKKIFCLVFNNQNGLKAERVEHRQLLPRRKKHQSARRVIVAI
jgi:hypothetical protein